MSKDEIIEILESHRRHGATAHPDDAHLRAQNDLLDDLIESFTAEFTNA